jgi:hypothetical protein
MFRYRDPSLLLALCFGAFLLFLVGLVVDNVAQPLRGPDPAVILAKRYFAGYWDGDSWQPPTYDVRLRVNDKLVYGSVSESFYTTQREGDPVQVFWHAGRLTQWTYVDLVTTGD